MENYRLESTPITPNIYGDIETGKVTISGKCFPENSVAFFAPFKQWLNDFFNHAIASPQLQLDFEYFNSSSASIILEVMKIFQRKNPSQKILWMVDREDPDMIDAAEEYNLILNDQLNLIEKSTI